MAVVLGVPVGLPEAVLEGLDDRAGVFAEFGAILTSPGCQLLPVISQALCCFCKSAKPILTQ